MAVSLTRLDPAEVVGLPDDELQRRVQALDELHVYEARQSAAAFMEYAIPHEMTGAQVENAPYHLEWHQHLDDHLHAVIFAPVEHGKTQQCAVARLLWVLGNNPSLRLAVISNTALQSEKILRAVRTHIEVNPRVHRVFPDLKPSRRSGDPWHNTDLTVERPTIARDPSVQARGRGGAIEGSRIDGIIGDDLDDEESTHTPEALAKTVNWWDAVPYTRLTADAFCWVIGTPWALGDLMHTLEDRPGFAAVRYSAVLNPDNPMERWEALWPAGYNADRLREKAANMLPLNFARRFLSRVVASEQQRFKPEWIRACLGQGRGRTLLERAPIGRNGKPLPCFTGVDLGVGQDPEHDLTALFTIAIDTFDRRLPRIVVNIESGRWTAPETLIRIFAHHIAYGAKILVEDNGAQDFLLQWAEAKGIPVSPFNTGRNKYDEAFGIESLAVEMRAGLWVIPSGPTGREIPPEVQQWIRELLYFTPGAHTGDRLMASWFAREGARVLFAKVGQHLPTIPR